MIQTTMRQLMSSFYITQSNHSHLTQLASSQHNDPIGHMFEYVLHNCFDTRHRFIENTNIHSGAKIEIRRKDNSVETR